MHLVQQTNQPTNFMEQNPSWEATGTSAIRENSGTWKLINMFTRAYVPILSQVNPEHAPLPNLISWRSILLFSHLCLGLPSSLFPSRFPHPNCVCTCPLPHTCHMPNSSHSSWFDHPNNIQWRVQFMKLLIKQPPPVPFSLVPLRPKYLHEHHILRHSHPMFLRQCERPRFTPI